MKRIIVSIHWCDSSIRFIDSIHWFDSLMRFIDSIHWYYDPLISIPFVVSLIRFIDSIHWYDPLISIHFVVSLIRFIDSIHWCDSLIRFIHWSLVVRGRLLFFRGRLLFWKYRCVPKMALREANKSLWRKMWLEAAQRSEMRLNTFKLKISKESPNAIKTK